jgi:hypothetical protein
MSPKQTDLPSKTIAVRMPAEDVARIDAIVSRFPAMDVSTVARQALRLGLTLIEEQPLTLLGDKPKPKSKSKQPRKG